MASLTFVVGTNGMTTSLTCGNLIYKIGFLFKISDMAIHTGNVLIKALF